MSTNSSLRDSFGLPAPIPTVGTTRSFSERRITHRLVRTGPFASRVSVARRLREEGLTLKEAHIAITELAERDYTICELPDDVDLQQLSDDLSRLDVGLRRPLTQPEPATYLTEVRTRHNLTQRQFADHLGLDLRTLQNWEQGRNRPDPAILTLVRIFDRNPGLVADAIFEPL